MTSEDWEGAISLLVSNLHRSDKDLLQLLQRCVAGQQIASMEEAQALLLKNFRVGKDKPSEFFFARVGALCAPRGTSHRVEFVWGV